MFFDPFTFTPPSPEVLTRAVESYQRVAAARFCRYARDAMDPDLLPIKVRGDLLDPTPKQLHAEVRALRHLTAIQRTLRDIGGPLFDPNSPISPEDRFRLVDRRLDAIDEALGEPSEETIQRIVSCPQDGSASSSSDFSSDNRLRRMRPLRLENSSSDLSPVDSPRSPRSPRLGNASSDKPDFYHPPEIEDLLEAVNFAQRVFAARAELLDKRRLTPTPEDFLLEIASLRDLTAIVRTLRRMSARRLPEDQTHDDLQRELNAGSGALNKAPDPLAAPLAPSEKPAHPSGPSYASPVSVDVPPPAAAAFPASPGNLPPSHSSQVSHPSHGPAGSSSSEVPNPQYKIPNAPQSHASSESVSSVKSVGNASACSSSPRLRCSRRLRLEPSSLRPVPRVPEVRPAVPSPAKRSSHRSHPSHNLSESVASVKSGDRSSSPRFASLYREDDPGPWGNWETPPPEAIDESSPEFLADMKRFGYVAAWRRAASRLSGDPPARDSLCPSPEMILSDSDPPPD